MLLQHENWKWGGGEPHWNWDFLEFENRCETEEGSHSRVLLKPVMGRVFPLGKLWRFQRCIFYCYVLILLNMFCCMIFFFYQKILLSICRNGLSQSCGQENAHWEAVGSRILENHDTLEDNIKKNHHPLMRCAFKCPPQGTLPPSVTIAHSPQCQTC